MRTIIKTLFVVISLGLASSGANAHSMEPGYIKKYSTGPEETLYYTIENEYDFPAVFRIRIYEKDGKTPAHGWRVSRTLFKIAPGNEKRFAIKIESTSERKVLVCSELTGIGYNNEEPTIITRVCSRLWLK